MLALVMQQEQAGLWLWHWHTETIFWLCHHNKSAVLTTAPDMPMMCAGREKEQVRKVVGRNRYFTPPQAIEYGLIDRIVRPEDAVAIEEKNYEQMLQQANAQQRGQQRVPAGASAEGGY